MAPAVELTDESYSTLTARWGDLNVDAEGWVVALANEEGQIGRVSIDFTVLLYRSL